MEVTPTVRAARSARNVLICSAFAALFAWPVAAEAQESLPAPPVNQPPTTAPADVTENVSPIQKIDLHAISDFGQELSDIGIYPTARYLGQFADNPVGGQRQGAGYDGELTFGATFDMRKLANIPGASIHVLFTDRSGSLISNQYINTSLSVQDFYGADQTYQLTAFTWEQRLFNDKVDINVGRTDIAFLYSAFNCDFESHGLCGRPYGMSKNLSTSVYPETVWGGRVLVAPTPNLYGKIGVYQPNADLEPGESHGFDWGIHRANGVVVPVEFGYTEEAPGAVAPDQYDIGYITSSAPYSAPYYDKTDPNFEYRGAITLQAQKRIYQPEDRSPRGIYLFGMGLVPTDGGKQQANYQVAGGFIWQGPYAGRPLDRIDFQVNDYDYNKTYLDSLYAKRLKAHGFGFPQAHQTTIELNYLYQANRWLQLEPVFQYIWHPDGLGTQNYPSSNIHNAAVFGFQFQVDIAALFRLKSYPVSLVLDN